GENQNVAWKVKIEGRGTSSPVVWGDRVFVTTAINTGLIDPSRPTLEDQPERVFGIKHPNTGYQMTVLCFDRNTGKELWRDVAQTLVPHEGHHKDASYASASPFCDGERIYCWFGSAGMFAYDLDGKKLWGRDLGKAKVGASLGEGSSPVVHDGKIVIIRDHGGQSTIEVLESKDGETLWKKDRDEGNAWATPAITEHNGVIQVITTASNKIRSYDLETGEIIWEAQGLTGNCTPCPIVDGEVVYCMSGYEGYSLLAIPITGKGDVTDSAVWKAVRGIPYIPSPILYDGLLYFTQSNQNLLTCLEANDGSPVIDRERLPGIGGIYASPVGADGRIYLPDREGNVLVLQRGREMKVLATNQLDDSFHASPALAGKQIFLRGLRFLYCIKDAAADNKPIIELLDHIRSAEEEPRGKSQAAAKPSSKKQSEAGNSGFSQPNVVVLLADDLGWKDLGCYGGPVKTPHLDRLAGSGVRFTDFYSGAAVCSPSRATLLTGRHHVRSGVYSWISDNDQDSHLLESEITLAEILKANGYQTAHFGKWHLGAPFRGRDKPWIDQHGFDYWFATDLNAAPSHRNPTNFWRNRKRIGELKGYACQLVVDEAIGWLEEEHKDQKPFFLNVWFHEPHAPIAAPEEIVADYGAANDAGAIYSGTIDHTDRAIGRLLEKLRAMGVLEETLVIYSSDNGSYLKDRVGELRGTKGSNLEGGIRVPGIFSWPGTIPGRRVSREPAGQIDIVPTICGLAGIETPKGVHIDGSDISPLLLGKTETITRHQPLAWILPTSGSPIALRDGTWSLIGRRSTAFPRDREAMSKLIDQMVTALREKGDSDPEATVRAKLFEGFGIPELDRIRGRYVQLNQFNESWIPAIKAMTYDSFELYDLSSDLGQKTDVAKYNPEVFSRLKSQLLSLTAEVIEEAPDWSKQR
ncbi:MAG: arylsulfatase A, partial [Verrucomicrobiales bacterium]